MATYRQIHTHIWDDPHFEELSPQAKLVFIYSFSNKHRNEAGLYNITVRKLAFETGLSQEDAEKAIKEIEANDMVRYDWDNHVLWAKNSLKYQSVSSKCIVAILKNLTTISSPLVQEYKEYYKDILYPIDTLSIPHATSSDTHPGNGKGNGKGNGNGKSKVKGKNNKPPTPLKNKYAEFVKMTQEEHQKLIDQHGAEFTARCIEVLDNYKGSKGTTYKSDYRAILNWVVERVTEEQQKGGANRGPTGQPTGNSGRHPPKDGGTNTQGQGGKFDNLDFSKFYFKGS